MAPGTFTDCAVNGVRLVPEDRTVVMGSSKITCGLDTPLVVSKRMMPSPAGVPAGMVMANLGFELLSSPSLSVAAGKLVQRSTVPVRLSPESVIRVVRPEDAPMG